LDKGELFNNIGIIHAEYGDTLLALRYYSDALKIANQIQHKDLETRVLNNIGNVYLSQEQFLIAIKFFKLSLDISTEISNLLSSSIVLKTETI